MRTLIQLTKEEVNGLIANHIKEAICKPGQDLYVTDIHPNHDLKTGLVYIINYDIVGSGEIKQ